MKDEREHAKKSLEALKSVVNTEFINDNYTRSREPMNLLENGQQWFGQIFERQMPARPSTALVLGGTPWLGRLLRRKQERVIMADLNPAMLETAKAAMADDQAASLGEVEFMQSDWLTLPHFCPTMGIVAGDNCFNFLRFPEGWVLLLDRLAERMSESSRLIVRFMSIPPTHEIFTIDQIVDRFLSDGLINYTAVRAAVLFANWNALTNEIDTEKVLALCEENRDKFHRLFRKCPPSSENDFNIGKYRHSGYISFTPPLSEILRLLAARFRVTDVHFGPYLLSEYFPLIIATLR